MRPTPSPGPSSPPARRRPALLVGAVAAVLLVAAVAYTALLPAGGPAAPSGGPVSFGAVTPAGQQVTVPGGRPSVVLFFGVTCGGCGPAATALAQIQQQDPGAANVVGVDITPGETDGDVRGFLTTNHATGLGYAFDRDATLIRALGVTQLTTVVVLDASGAPTWRAVDPTREQVQAALATQAPR